MPERQEWHPPSAQLEYSHCLAERFSEGKRVLGKHPEYDLGVSNSLVLALGYCRSEDNRGAVIDDSLCQ